MKFVPPSEDELRRRGIGGEKPADPPKAEVPADKKPAKPAPKKAPAKE